MFTGLIEATGAVLAVTQREGTLRIKVSAPGLAGRLRTGDSVSVSGVCLTALDISTEPPVFHADLAAETVARTSLSKLQPGSGVNLELPTPAGTPLGGHVVQGHVDGTGTLLSLESVSTGGEEGDWWLRIGIPEHLMPYMVEKGSIAIEGISLTIARVEKEAIAVAIIPHTYRHTNLSTLLPGSPVNLEADVLLKFAEQKKKDRFELSLEYLIANGY